MEHILLRNCWAFGTTSFERERIANHLSNFCHLFIVLMFKMDNFIRKVIPRDHLFIKVNLILVTGTSYCQIQGYLIIVEQFGREGL